MQGCGDEEQRKRKKKEKKKKKTDFENKFQSLTHLSIPEKSFQ